MHKLLRTLKHLRRCVLLGGILTTLVIGYRDNIIIITVNSDVRRFYSLILIGYNLFFQKFVSLET